MELPELSSASLTAIAITAGLVVVGFLALWLVVRSAVLSALTAHEKRRMRDSAVPGPRRREAVPTPSGESKSDVAVDSAGEPAGVPTGFASPAPAPALAPPVGEAHPPAPYVVEPPTQTIPPATPPVQQPSNAAAAAAALYQSHPAPQPAAPQAALPQPAQPQPAAPAGQHVVMSASDPNWAPPASATGNPFHITGDAPIPAPYELPVADPAAPRRF